MSLFLANILGLLYAHWKFLLSLVICVVLLFTFVAFVRSCKPKPKLDEQHIQKAEQAVKDRNDAELKKILVEADTREAVIDSNVSDAGEKTEAVKQEAEAKYEAMSSEDLAKELEARK